jgi:Zn-dependent protease/CBS domain-containing protein
VRGIRVAVDWSWFLILFLLIVWLTRVYGDVLDESSTATAPFMLAVASAVGFFGSIVLHELGHAYAASRCGIGILSIQLWIFGGVARMDRESDSPATEFKVGIAGPVVTFAIFVLLSVAGIVATGPGDFWRAMLFEPNSGAEGVPWMLAWLASINLLLLLFNMLPAYPMDGGKVARAIAWWRTGDRTSATRFAATLGRGFAYLFIGGGLLWIVEGEVFGGLWLALIGMVLNGSARGATMQTALSRRIEGMRVADVMDREPVAIPGELSVEQALDQYFLRYRWPWFPVVDAAGRFVGVLREEGARDAVEGGRPVQQVRELMEADESGRWRIDEDQTLRALLDADGLRTLGAMMVLDGGGVLRGVVTLGRLRRALRAALGRGRP